MSKIQQLHKEQFPDDLFKTKVRVKEMNDELVPWPVYKYMQWKSDPWLWIKEQVYTVDEADYGSVKLFPPYEYLHRICDLYFEHKITVIPKTRRMIMTHLFFSGILPWAFLFCENSDNIFVSMSQDKAKKAFRRRARKTLEHLDMRFGFYPELKDNLTLLSDKAINPDNGAELSAVPAGADKCRGDTLTNAAYDEFAFQTYCEENLAALKPALDGKDCRGAIISSPFPGTVFEDLCKIREGSSFKQVMQGLSVTENQYNHLVIKCHYKAHPEKRSQEWYYRERYGTTPDGKPIPGASGVSTFTWLQEYEGEFNFPKGTPAISEFSEELHCEPYTKLYSGGYDPEHTLDISFDFGSRYPAVVFTQKDSFNRFVIHNGLMVANERQSAFLERVKSFLNERFEGWESDFKLFCDPSGFKETRGGNAEPEAIELEKFFGKRVINRKRHHKPIDRVRSIDEQAAVKCGDAMGLVVAPDAGIFINEVGKEEYGVIVKALAYGYCFKQKKGLKEAGKKDTGLELEKDGFFDHFVDTIGYIAVFRWPCRQRFKDQVTQARTPVSANRQKRKRSLRR